MSKTAIVALFEAMFILTDLRVILRRTAPHHALGAGEREEVRALIEGLEKRVDVLKRELLA
ncbi:MAG: hypothetical protein QXL43_00875 [Methanolinea sp.]|nr:hypothetical protein [Methanolinea sp.]